ncbi:uncharacterized protein BX663DRAFT_525347 [Cokeromyces recurvatus]|uniref:uncharacterized protein n=1 Tax=Cokeromyces recurvatus TaxID=90255 RepID=UPI002220D49F|nr:uncharacterized protein BX663DRAFT_525347 [Cokeromyces recurvatus]KAI7898296.1 hypothetical protein BX663DRAFT_525347 [Cokeromyces recurvatus]
MIVIESCRLVLMIAGRYKQVRCYSYDALLRLVYAVLSLDWSERRDKQFDVPTQQIWEQITSRSGNKLSDEDHCPSTNGFSLNLKERLVKKREEKKMTSNEPLVLCPGLIKPYYIYNKCVLQDFYYKLPDSRDAQCLRTYQTSTYLFIAIHCRDKIILWQRKRTHMPCSLFRLKVFWIPTEAKLISFADDRSALRSIIAVFANEATVIELRDSKVTTVPIDPTLERIYQTTWIQDQYEHQLLSLSQSLIPNASDMPAIQWTSLVQLPFYPTLPVTSLTINYSIPPSYTTVMESLPSTSPDPVALPSTSAPQLFFATLSKQSYIIDLSGALFSTQVYRWSETPHHIEFLQLNEWCVLGFGSETVEILDFRTAQVVQRVMHGAPVKFLGRGQQDNIFWSCAAMNERTHVYMLKAEDV